jgi:hypothetical protein
MDSSNNDHWWSALAAILVAIAKSLTESNTDTTTK